MGYCKSSRSVSILNTDGKLFKSVTRLEAFLPNLVYENQRVFIEGGQTQDNQCTLYIINEVKNQNIPTLLVSWWEKLLVISFNIICK